MRITLIENAYGLVAVGTRTLAAFLKRAVALALSFAPVVTSGFDAAMFISVIA